jgi:hypothetical protein
MKTKNKTTITTEPAIAVEPVLATRESGIRFTHIKINKIVKNKAYVAKFNYGYSNMSNSHLLIETTIHGISPQNCIDKVEKFLETKLAESEYSFHGC